MSRFRRSVATVALLVAGACAAGREGSAPTTGMSGPAPTVVPPRGDPAAAPTTTATIATAGSPPVPPPGAPSCPPTPPRSAPAPHRPRYELRVDIRPGEGLVTGELAVHFVPDLPVDRLVFRLWANSPRLTQAGGRLDAGPVTIDGQPSPATLADPTTLVVPLAPARGPGAAVVAAMPFVLRLPGPVSDRIARVGDSVRLGSFFPLLAWEPGAGWATEPPTAGFAEASTSPVADFDVTVTLPPGLGVLTSGTHEGGGRFRATAVRDFAISVGRFRVAEGTAMAPQPVQVQVGLAEGLPEAPEAYLARVVRLLEAMAARYGPYPWPSFTLAVTPGLRGGIEYPAHVMQGPGHLGRTTTHEVAHQWFYALVGSNQGRDPWLDEGLASWAEARADGTLRSFVARPIPPVARGRLGEPMSWWDRHLDAYYRGVYVQTVQALAAAAPPDVIDCALAHYVARHAFGIARPGHFGAALEGVAPGATAVLARFGVRP